MSVPRPSVCDPYSNNMDTDWVCGSDGKTYACEWFFYAKNWRSACADPPVYIEHQGYCTGKSLQVIFHVYM